jgi:hypothetical protein
MVRFSFALRVIVSIAFVLAVAPVIARWFAMQTETPGILAGLQPGPTAQLAAMADLPWLMPTILFLFGLTIGMWADWSLRTFDNVRRLARKGFGERLTRLAEDIARLEFAEGAKSNGSPGWPRNLGGQRRTIASALARMQKLGIWNPGRAAFQIPRGGEFLIDFFREIGMLLANERFDEAKTRARAAQLRFELIGRRL